MLKSAAAVVGAYRRAEICATVDLTGLSGVRPGFNIGMIVVADRVLETAGNTVRYRRTRAPLLRLE